MSTNYTYRRIDKPDTSALGGWAIQENCFNLIKELLPAGGTILELGSGLGTHYLSQHYQMYSIENAPEWVGKYNSTYIHAPIKKYNSEWPAPPIVENKAWYDPESLKDKLPAHYDLILIDGPEGQYGRGGFYKHLDLFNTDAIMIFDDIHRAPEYELMVKVSAKVGRPWIALDKYTGYIL
jgi:hypothetical protein